MTKIRKFSPGDPVHWFKDDETYLVVGYKSNGEVVIEQEHMLYSALEEELFTAELKTLSDEELLEVFLSIQNEISKPGHASQEDFKNLYTSRRDVAKQILQRMSNK